MTHRPKAKAPTASQRALPRALPPAAGAAGPPTEANPHTRWSRDGTYSRALRRCAFGARPPAQSAAEGGSRGAQMQARAARTCKHARALKGRLKGKRPKACAGGGSGEFKKGRVCVCCLSALSAARLRAGAGPAGCHGGRRQGASSERAGRGAASQQLTPRGACRAGSLAAVGIEFVVSGV